MQIYLENEGYNIIKATDGIEGFEILEDQPQPVDLIILDIMMPRMDGLEFCKKARQHSQVPILMVSAKAGDIDKINRTSPHRYFQPFLARCYRQHCHRHQLTYSVPLSQKVVGATRNLQTHHRSPPLSNQLSP